MANPTGQTARSASFSLAEQLVLPLITFRTPGIDVWSDMDVESQQTPSILQPLAFMTRSKPVNAGCVRNRASNARTLPSV